MHTGRQLVEALNKVSAPSLSGVRPSLTLVKLPSAVSPAFSSIVDCDGGARAKNETV